MEKNHEFIRQILPKKTSFVWLTQDTVDLVMSHINSYPRARLNDKSPFEVAEFLMGKPMLARLKLKKIPVENIQLHPILLKEYRFTKQNRAKLSQ